MFLRVLAVLPTDFYARGIFDIKLMLKKGFLFKIFFLKKLDFLKMRGIKS